MAAVALWLSVAAACAMLFHPLTRSAAMMILAGSTLALFLHYDIAIVPGVRNIALFLWTAAAVLLASNFLAQRRRRSA